MLLPSTITARRTRRYTSTLYIHRTIHGVGYNPMNGGGRSNLQPPFVRDYPPARDNLPPPLTGGRATDPEDYPAHLSAYTTRAPDRIKRSAAELGPAVATFSEQLFDGPLPWAKVRQGHKLLRLGERYTAQRLDDACRRALDVDLIDVRRLERILVQALELEATPQFPLPMPPGRFARPGSVFAHSDKYRRQTA